MNNPNFNRNNKYKSNIKNNYKTFNKNENKFLGKKVYHKNFDDSKNYNYSKDSYNKKKYDERIQNRQYDNRRHEYRNYNDFNSNRNNNFQSNNNIENNKLPIFSKKDEILEKIRNNRVIIVSGNTGCGKSTQVPQFIYENSMEREILITQPRRIAAISIAKRLSFERGTQLGKLIGYHVSMIQNFSNNTKIFVKTTGIFMEELLHNNQLNYSFIILDEVHERDLYIDLVLALLKKYFEKFPDSDIKLILMSATIAESDFAEYLKDINNNKEIPIVRIEEKWHEVKKLYIDDILRKIINSDKINENLKKKIEEEKSNCISLGYELPIYSNSLFPVVAGIIELTEKMYVNSKKGILIFIPGFAEIQDLLEYLTNYFIDNYDLEFLILHSHIADDEQEKVFKYNEKKRKIILATNIAESSITISNIDFVIDFCLVKQLRFDDNQNTSVLELKWCSKASCQQRKGRTGRVAKGYYFQLITKELFKKFKEHQEPEILRTPLETPILKLKLYDKGEEPEVILFKTMNPPTQEIIVNTIFRLQKMGALVNIKFDENQLNDEKEEIIDSNGVIRKIKKREKKIKYSSGQITNIGIIFADLPIDIKYSRLIILSYSLGQIDIGISLAAILSQERPLFLNSNRSNRLSLYNSKKDFCYNQNCDFIALYYAYKLWCSKYKKFFIFENIDFDTKLKIVERNKYKEIKIYTKEHNLDLKTLKEIIRLENDLKRRLCLKGLYSKFFEPKGEEIKPLKFSDKKTSFILKIILSGTFYNQIFAPEYDDFQAVENDIRRKQDELTTIRISNISLDEKNKLVEIFREIIKPSEIEKEDYEDYSEMVTIKFSDVESVRKILFITSSCLRHNNEIPIFRYCNKVEKEDKEGINRNYTEDKTVLIRLGKEPNYIYNVNYYDIYIGGQIFLDKDSINLTYIIPNYEELKKTKFVTDSYINKNGNTSKKYARYTSLLPRVQMFDKLMMLIFGPKFEMIASRIENTNSYSHYIGFQSYEFVGPNFFQFDTENNYNSRKNIVKTNLIKLDYLITNYHLLIINEIRCMINKIIDFRFNLKDKHEKENNKNEKEFFEEKKNDYLKNTSIILSKIKSLVDEPKIKYINDKRYEELYNYIQDFKRKYKNIKNKNFEIKEEVEEKNEIEEKKEQENEPIYHGYINEIKKLKVKDEDFLQIHEPIEIQGEFFYSQIKKRKLLINEKKISNIYNDYTNVLNLIKSLAYNKEPWICCSVCYSEICAIKPGSPKMTENKTLGEHIIEGAWITSSLKSVKENKDKIDKEQMKKFKEQLKKNFVIYEDLFCCPNGNSVIGYIKNDKRYIYFGSNLYVKYPDLSIDIINEDDYKNDFYNILKKMEKKLKEKENPEYKKLICCKLCGFKVEKDIKEFKDHLNTRSHKERMEELKKEFLF